MSDIKELLLDAVRQIKSLPESNRREHLISRLQELQQTRQLNVETLTSLILEIRTGDPVAKTAYPEMGTMLGQMYLRTIPSKDGNIVEVSHLGKVLSRTKVSKDKTKKLIEFLNQKHDERGNAITPSQVSKLVQRFAK
jgi:hypothetical protein